MIAIKIENLTKIYKKNHLGKTYKTTGVENLDLKVETGEIFGLLGLNGSGKTTTIKLILGLLKPTTGTATVLGNPSSAQESLSKIGYLPEVPYFYRYLTAREILTLYGKLSNIKNLDSSVDNILDFVGLSSWKDKKVSEFSKGMAQRVGLAQSLLHNPQILIFDEPISGLDPLAIKEMRNLILKLKKEGKTILLSSHMISEVEKLCDKVGILVKGKLVKVLSQEDWKTAEGKLENIFISLVSGSAEIGGMQVNQ